VGSGTQEADMGVIGRGTGPLEPWRGALGALKRASNACSPGANPASRTPPWPPSAGEPAPV
jgi:hypothetical protein